MKNKIKLNKDTEIDLNNLIETRALIQANSGGGKSYAMRLFVERTFGKKQIVIIDPEGEFSNLRSEFDFVYIGKGGDAPAEPRSAALLARRLLETKANAIIDIFELGSQRGDFVKNFFDALVNMPKPLWTDCFFLLDEAHKFAPEKGMGESVALQSVIDMASLGRKRGYCLIPATQRPAKLSKDVVAECNNKLIGRASLDIDRERSAKELGFRSKEDILSLRNLEPGEFYVFGPAICRDVKKIQLDDIKVKPPKRGTGRSVKIAPPTEKVKKWLAELKDLPQEAEKEAHTVRELQAQVRTLKAANNTYARNAIKKPEAPVVKEVVQTKVIEKAVFKDSQITKLDKIFGKMYKETDKHGKAMALFWGEFNETGNALTKAFDAIKENQKLMNNKPLFFSQGFGVKPTTDTKPIRMGQVIKLDEVNLGKVSEKDMSALNSGEIKILKVIAQFQDEGITTEHIAVLTGYRKTSRVVYLQKLQAKGYVRKSGNLYFATPEGFVALGDNYEPLPTGDALREHILRTIPEGERKVLEVILHAYPESVSGETIEELTGYKKTSRVVYVQKLAAQKLIEKNGTMIKASNKLYD